MDNLDNLVAHIVGVVGYGDAVVAVAGHADGEVHALQEALLVNAAKDEAGFVEGFGTLCAGADAYGGDGQIDLLRQVIGYRRVPDPPANTIPFIFINDYL